MASVSSDVEKMLAIHPKVFPVTTPDIAVPGPFRDGLKVLLNPWPRLIASVAKVWGYLFIHFINMFLLHFSGNLSSEVLGIDLCLLAFISSNLVLDVCDLTVLRIAKLWESASAGATIRLELPKSQRDSTMAEAEEPIDLVQLPR